MGTEEERCADAKKFLRIHEAFRRGDLDGLRAALDDPALVPNGRPPGVIGSCLVHAIYHSPLSFIRTLLEIGADPNAPVGDGFPPLIAALSQTSGAPGAPPRDDADEIVRLLLAFGVDPNQRGFEDCTPLHKAVGERNAFAVQLLLEGGADPDLRTRIDECATPLEMAEAAGFTDIAAILERRGRPLAQRLRSGLTLLLDIEGSGEPLRRRHNYRIRLRLWLSAGEPVRWRMAWGPSGIATLEDNGELLITDIRIDRRALINGLFYGVEGMRIGGTRRLRIAPHLGYRDRGVPGVIPSDATLTAEITILEARPWP